MPSNAGFLVADVLSDGVDVRSAAANVPAVRTQFFLPERRYAAVPGEGSRGVASENGPALTVCDRWDGRVATVTVRGELDMSTVGILSQCLDKLARQGPERLVVDMSEVGFMDSAGLQAFVRARKALPEGCRIVVRSPRLRELKVFQLTGLSSILDFE